MCICLSLSSWSVYLRCKLKLNKAVPTITLFVFQTFLQKHMSEGLTSTVLICYSLFRDAAIPKDCMAVITYNVRIITNLPIISVVGFFCFSFSPDFFGLCKRVILPLTLLVWNIGNALDILISRMRTFPFLSCTLPVRSWMPMLWQSKYLYCSLWEFSVAFLIPLNLVWFFF